MLFYESITHQSFKHGQIVCGDYISSARLKSGSYFGVFDGIGSGIYANITAIECGNRWLGMIENALSFSETCEMLASSMHKARSRAFPFTAFNCARLTGGGHGQIFTYEAPKPVLMRNGMLHVIEPNYYTVGYEIIGESKVTLEEGDQLLLFSDGVSQAGLGESYTFGWGETGFAEYYAKQRKELDNTALLERVAEECRIISGGRHEDDTSIILIKCRSPEHLNIFTGPPSTKEKDKVFAKAFKKAQGKKIICGSTTTDIFARELNETIKLKEKGLGYNSPPEYEMKGAEMVTEGAMVLNQVSNILDADEIEITTDTSPERIALLFYRADIIHFHVGNARNKTHQLLPFRQLGIKERSEVLKDIAEKLKAKGKMVYFDYY